MSHRKKQCMPRGTEPSGSNNIVKAAFCGGIAGLCVTFLLLLLFSWAFTKTDIPFWAAVPLATAAVCVGCFISGSIVAKRIGKNGLFCGLCTGAFFFLLYFVAAMINGQFEFTAVGSIKLVSCILSGSLGGYLGIVMKEKRCAKARHSA